MNRGQRRGFVKRAQKKGVDKEAAEVYARMLSGDGGIRDGDKVKLNVQEITSRKNYERMTDEYKTFIDENKDSVFTAHIERRTLTSFVEDPRWLFWCGDLLKVREDEQ